MLIALPSFYEVARFCCLKTPSSLGEEFFT